MIFLRILPFLFQVVPKNKLRPFFKDRATPPAIPVPDSGVALTFLTYCLYSHREHDGRGGGQRLVLKNVFSSSPRATLQCL